MKSSHFSQRHSHATIAQLLELFLVLLFVAVALVSFPIYAYGAQTIHLCVKNNGYLRLPTKAIPCAQDEYAVSWTMVQPAELEALQSRITQLESLLAGVSRQGDSVVFSGVNVQIVNGMGDSSTANSLGNLILGYNENEFGYARTGSHYLVIGKSHGYTNWNGIVAGYNNRAYFAEASVLGGSNNQVSAWAGTISGGWTNTITDTGTLASITGGAYNKASKDFVSVSGGYGNTANGYASSATGGAQSTVNGDYASVTGGQLHIVNGQFSSISGGLSNQVGVTGKFASVTGGQQNHASGDYSSVTGGSSNNANGTNSSILGGYNNAAGNQTSVWGGHDRTVTAASGGAFGLLTDNERSWCWTGVPFDQKTFCPY
jgi:hypothetical protein